jgi:hypothetical protein
VAAIEKAASHAQASGMADLHVKAANNWYNVIVTRGPDQFVPTAPSRADDAKRSAEIEKMMRENPDEYFASAELQREHFDIIARLQGEIRKSDNAMMATGLKDYAAAVIERRNLHVVDLNRV